MAARPLLISISPGPQYRFGGFTAQGNHSLDAKQIRDAYAMQAGELASSRLMSQTLENIRKAYQHVGLRNVVVVPTLRFDEKVRVIYVDLQVDEGTG